MSPRGTGQSPPIDQKGGRVFAPSFSAVPPQCMLPVMLSTAWSTAVPSFWMP